MSCLNEGGKLRVPVAKRGKKEKKYRLLNMPNCRSLYPRLLKSTPTVLYFHIYFFLPLGLDLEPALEFVDATLEAREGDVELALLPVADFTLSRALFYRMC